jgi:hypothetical protein
MYTTQGDFIERFIMPPPDYPTIDNVLMVQPSDKECWWSIHREKSAGEITANQKTNKHCYEPGLETAEMMYKTPPPPLLPVKEPHFPYTAPIIQDCTYSDWSKCSENCGPGKQVRTIVKPVLNGGKCSSQLEQDCNLGDCKPPLKFWAKLYTEIDYKGVSITITQDTATKLELNQISDSGNDFSTYEYVPTFKIKSMEFAADSGAFQLYTSKGGESIFGLGTIGATVKYNLGMTYSGITDNVKQAQYVKITTLLKQSDAPPPAPICQNLNWTMCSGKCISGIKRRYNNECKIEEKPCSHLFKLLVYSDQRYKGKTKLLTCADMDYVHNDDPQWFSLKVWRPFGVESYKWIEWDSENIEHIHAEFIYVGGVPNNRLPEIPTHTGLHATDLETINDPDVDYIKVHIKMKGDGDVSRIKYPTA